MFIYGNFKVMFIYNKVSRGYNKVINLMDNRKFILIIIFIIIIRSYFIYQL